MRRPDTDRRSTHTQASTMSDLAQPKHVEARLAVLPNGAAADRSEPGDAFIHRDDTPHRGREDKIPGPYGERRTERPASGVITFHARTGDCASKVAMPTHDRRGEGALVHARGAPLGANIPDIPRGRSLGGCAV